MGRKKKYAPDPSQNLYEIPFDYWGFKRWCVNQQDLSESTANVYISNIRTAFKTMFADDDALFKNLRNAFFSHTGEPERRIARLEDNFETLVAYTETIDECGDDWEHNLPKGVSKSAPKEDWVRAFQCYCRYIRWRIDTERKHYGMEIEIKNSPFYTMEIPMVRQFRHYMKTKGKGYPVSTINTYSSKLKRLYNLLIRRVDKKDGFTILGTLIERGHNINPILDKLQEWIDFEKDYEVHADLSDDDVERGRNAFVVYREFLEDLSKNPDKYPKSDGYEIPWKKDQE